MVNPFWTFLAESGFGILAVRRKCALNWYATVVESAENTQSVGNAHSAEKFAFDKMSKRDYPGYPEIVVIALPKCGTKTLNKCFTQVKSSEN